MESTRNVDDIIDIDEKKKDRYTNLEDESVTKEASILECKQRNLVDTSNKKAYLKQKRKKKSKVTKGEGTKTEQVKKKLEEEQIIWYNGDVKQLDPENDMLSADEMRDRVMVLFILFTLLLEIVSVGFICTCNSNSSQTLPKVFEPYIHLESKLAMPRPRIISLSKAGMVQEICFNPSFSLMKSRIILKLQPFSNGIMKKAYFLSMPWPGTFNFVDNNLHRKIVSFSTGKGHKTIARSNVIKKEILQHIDSSFHKNGDDDNFDLCFKQAVQVGDKFWLLEPDFCSTFNVDFNDHRWFPGSVIWYSKREKWGLGPDLPKKTYFHPRSRFCILAINSSFVMFFLGKEELYHKTDKVTGFNFDTKIWTQFPRVTNFVAEDFMECSAALTFQKDFKKRLILISSDFEPLEEHEYWTIFGYDLSDGKRGKWDIIQDRQEKLGIVGHHLFITKGILLSLYKTNEKYIQSQVGEVLWTNQTITAFKHVLDDSTTTGESMNNIPLDRVISFMTSL